MKASQTGFRGFPGAALGRPPESSTRVVPGIEEPPTIAGARTKKLDFSPKGNAGLAF